MFVKGKYKFCNSALRNRVPVSDKPVITFCILVELTCHCLTELCEHYYISEYATYCLEINDIIIIIIINVFILCAGEL